MRLWPFRYEIRQQLPADSATNNYLNDLTTYLDTPGGADVYRTAAVEFCAGILGRAFMAAETTPRLAALDPLTLSMLVRQTILLGNAVFRLSVRSGNIQLLPVVGYTITGSPAPETWTYRIKQQRPNGDDPLDVEQLPVTAVPYEGMVHVRYMPGPQSPWHGVSPLVSAGVTAETLARIEKSLQDDAKQPTGGIMPQPDGASPRAVKQAQTAMSQGKGGLTLVETTAGGWGLGGTAAPRQDWDQKRFGPTPPAANIQLWEAAMAAVMSAMAINPSLYTSAGAALRESYRHLFSGTIIPLGRLIEAELSEKLERRIRINFPERVRSDISAMSRAYGSLAGSDDPAWAASVVGLPPPPKRATMPVVVDPEDEPQAVVPVSNNGNTPRRYVHHA